MFGDAVCIEIIEEGADDRIGFGDVHFLGLELGHLGGVDTGEVGPTGLEDQFMDVDRWRGMDGGG